MRIRTPRWMPTKRMLTGGLVQHGRLWPYLGGCVTFAFGAYLFISSHLGTDPLDVFALGLIRHVPLTVGIAQAGVAALCLVTVALWTRHRPILSPLFTFFFCGSIIDVLRATDAQRAVPLGHYPMLAAGVLLCAYGSALIIASGFGIRAMDLLAITIVAHWRWSFWVAKGTLEMLLLASGALMSGPVGIGTVCFLVGVDLLIQPMVRANGHLLRIHNHGLPPRLPVGAQRMQTEGAG